MKAEQGAESDVRELVGRAVAGDKAAFGGLVKAFQRPLFAAVLRVVRHQQDARDIVQKSFLKAWTKLPTLEDPGKFRSWLFSIAINLSRNHCRDRGSKRFERVEENTLVVEDDASRRLDRAERRALLYRALEKLPARQREVVTLRVDAELSFRDIGESVGCTEASARVNFHHGMKRLRAILQEARAV